MLDHVKWYDHNADHPPWIKALAAVRHRACRKGWCYHHVQAIIVSIDQLRGSGNIFLNKPHSIGGSRNTDIPMGVSAATASRAADGSAP